MSNADQSERAEVSTLCWGWSQQRAGCLEVAATGACTEDHAFPSPVFTDSHTLLCGEQTLKYYFTKEVIKASRDLHLRHGHYANDTTWTIYKMLWGTLGVSISTPPPTHTHLFQTNCVS